MNEPTLIPTPTPVILRTESRFSLITKFLSWLTACVLAISVLIALISATSERNDLRSQVKDSNKSQVCRAAAGVKVNQAIIDEQIALAEHNVSVGEFLNIIIRKTSADPTYATDLKALADRIDAVNERLGNDGKNLQIAVTEQQRAILSC